VLEFIGTGRSDYLSPLVLPGREDVLVALADHLAGMRPRPIVHVPDVLRGEQNAERLIELLRERGLHCASWGRGVCPYAQLTGSYEEFLSSKSSSVRYNLRRERKLLHQLGEAEIVCHRNGELTSDLFERIAAVEQQSWKSEVRTPRLTGAGRGFLESALRALGMRGAAEVWTVRLNGQEIAYAINLLAGDRLYYYNTSFDQSYAKHSPGKVLTAACFEHACETGVKEFDFLRGDEPYKRFWANAERNVMGYVLYRGAWQWLGSWVLFRAKWTLARVKWLRSLRRPNAKWARWLVGRFWALWEKVTRGVAGRGQR
jgi:CelD/BcsL family acetyltransferase involved in cellulose biosynthesis